MYERAFEEFVLEMASKYVHDDTIRTKLRKLAGPSDMHGTRIAAEILRLDKTLGSMDRASVERAALLDVLEVERAARRFYLRFVEEIHDPKVAELFRDLAREEAAHVHIAEDALAMNDKKHARPRLSAATQRLLRLMDEDLLRWERTSDLGPTHMTKA